VFDGIADSCVGPVVTRDIPDPRRTGWLLAANPYAVLADASPWEGGGQNTPFSSGVGPLNAMSGALRLTQRDPVAATECL
ncbi:hypothetical protein HER21_49975, partial [Pseudomonas sp. BGM005]|nr:hypothetical protein [Pseudomonas sp. BG5]